MRKLPLLLATMFLSASLSATPLSTSSWDGTPPGTLADLTGSTDFSFGLPDFGVGVWRISVDGGYSTLYSSDVVGFEGDTRCAALLNGCTLQKPGPGNPPPCCVLEVGMDHAWHLWGKSQFLNHATSNGPQFAFTQVNATTWKWGFEDLPGGDFDYQDVFGTLQYVRPLMPPVDPISPATAPEPTSGVLAVTGMALIGWRLRR